MKLYPKHITYPLSLLSIIIIQLSSCTNNSGRPDQELPLTIHQDEDASPKGQSDLFYRFPDTKEGYLKAADSLTNPLMPSSYNIRKGKDLYMLYCKHCHGINGNSKAPMIDQRKYPPPPNFRSRLPLLRDGQIFHSLHFGKNLMPGNEKELNDEEKWQLVFFIKTFAESNPEDKNE